METLCIVYVWIYFEESQHLLMVMLFGQHDSINLSPSQKYRVQRFPRRGRIYIRSLAHLLTVCDLTILNIPSTTILTVIWMC